MTSLVADQGTVPACVAVALCTAISAANRGTPFACSWAFQHFNGVRMAGQGSVVEGCFAAAARHGFCPESAWPSSPAVSGVQPSAVAYRAAKAWRLGGTLPAVGLENMLAAIGAGMGCLLLYETRLLQSLGLPVRAVSPKHASAVVRVDVESKAFVVRNTWGPCWNDGGEFLLPWEVVERGGLINTCYGVYLRSVT